MDKNNILEALARDFGLELIMEQNDLEDVDVIEMLYDLGKIDIEDYMFEDVNDEE